MKPNTKIQNIYKNINMKKEIQGLLKRLYIQIYRRPSSFIIGIIQPLLWLILFGALFQNAPINLFGKYNIKYIQFLNYGIIIFCAFTSSLNTGLPIIFDREFGFLNRIIISPIINKSSLFFSLMTYTLTISIIQIISLIFISKYLITDINNIFHFLILIIITILISIKISNLSIYMSFILPGHVEFLAFTLLINLPILFSSTALAPLTFMPYWLQMITCINPLTYAIEIIRYICINKYINWNEQIIETIWFSINIKNSLYILIILNLFSFILIKKILQNKYS